MFRWANRQAYLLILPAFLLAGCATGYHRNIRNVPDWEAEDSISSSPPAASAINTDTNTPGIEPPQPVAAAVPQAVTTLPEPRVAEHTAATAPSVPTNVPSAPASTPQPKTSSARPTEPSPSMPAWVQLGRWCKAHNLPPPRASLFGAQPAYSITTPGGVFAFHIGSTVATWQGVQLWLGFVPRLVDGQPALHALDVQKNLIPLALGSSSTPPASHVIVIDPGHGGENGGTRGVIARGVEKDYTLDWAQRLLPLLQAHGWTVFLTRTNDTDLALSNRVAFAELHHADLFISLHFNSSAPDETQYGLETYCLPPAGMPSGVTRGFNDEIRVTFPNNAFDQQNLELALRVHRALLGVNGGHDRGIRRARFPGVLRNQQRPAILIEGGYLSNRGEATLIATPGHRQKLAEALAMAIGSAATQVAQAQENPISIPPPTIARQPAPAPILAPAPPSSAVSTNSKNALYDEP